MPDATHTFDASGTPLDVNAAARQAATQPGHDWRLGPSQYNWLRAVADRRCAFRKTTDPALRRRRLALCRELGARPEVPAIPDLA